MLLGPVKDVSGRGWAKDAKVSWKMNRSYETTMPYAMDIPWD